MERFDIPVDRRGTGSIKWDRAKGKFSTDKELIPLWIADTDFKAPPEAMEAVAGRAEHGVYGYSFAGRDYISSVAGWFNREYGLGVEESWVCPTYGVVTALYFTILALTVPGDRVMIHTPIYDPFYAIIRNTGREIVDCGLVHEDGTYRIDYERMEEQMKAGVRLLIFCNPHNPTGRVWRREELLRVAGLCSRYDVYLASDEIHCDLALFGNPFTSMLAFDEIHSRLAVYTSPGKTFSMTGLIVSNLLIPDPQLRERIMGKLRGAWIMSPNLFGMSAAKAAYDNGRDWLQEEKRYLEENSRFVSDYIGEHMPEIGVTAHEGTYLMWLDLNCLGLDGQLCGTLVEECGIGVGDGLHYGEAGRGFIRLNIGCARSLLAKALGALEQLYIKRTAGRS